MSSHKNRNAAGIAVLITTIAMCFAAWWFFFRQGPVDSSETTQAPDLPSDSHPLVDSSAAATIPGDDSNHFQVELERIAETQRVTTPMTLNAHGVWRQTIQVPKKAALVSLIVERTSHRGDGRDIRPVVWGESEKWASMADKTDTLHATNAAGTAAVLGPYFTNGEESVSISMRGAPPEDSLFRVREIQVWRSLEDYQLLGTIFDGDDVVDADDRTQKLGESLALLILDGSSCSGFAISDQLLLTNHHCVRKLLQSRKNDICPGVKIIFRMFKDDPTDIRTVARCMELVVYSRPMDYALIRFEVVSPNRTVRGLPVSAYRQGPPNDDALFILQHPHGMPAQVTTCGPPRAVDLGKPTEARLKQVRLSCQINNSLFTPVIQQDTQAVMTYKCDTEPGSSGSPVIQGGHVVGLHFASDYRYYQSDGRLLVNASHDCVKTKLKLWNWGRGICEVLADARRLAPKVPDIPECQVASPI